MTRFEKPATAFAQALGAIALMIDWFLNRKRKTRVAEFEQHLVKVLCSAQPKIGHIHPHSKIETIFVGSTPQPFIQLLHSIDGSYLRNNKGKHKDVYNLSGIQIKDIASNEFIDLKVQVTWDLISQIYIDHPDKFWTYYDMESIRLSNLLRTEIEVNKEDENKLRKILRNLDNEELRKLEIEDTFEIDLDGRKFLTILDMEDGNYIAVNNRGNVFRLHHDSNEEIRLINKSIEAFVNEFSGDKEHLEKFFDN